MLGDPRPTTINSMLLCIKVESNATMMYYLQVIVYTLGIKFPPRIKFPMVNFTEIHMFLTKTGATRLGCTLTWKY